MDVAVDQGRILYKETIAAPVEGVGHFEPLRHYAEVHLLLEPLPQGSAAWCWPPGASEDVLDRPLAAAHPHPPGRAAPTGASSPGPPSRT